MDDIEQRLRSAADTCIASHGAWQKDPKDTATRESLMESVHELRKVAARLEIMLAISEREETAARPIPIPPHRSSRKGGYGGDNNFAEDNIGNADDNFGNRGGGHQGGGHQGGGGQGGGGFRDRGPGGQGPRGPRRRMGMSGPQGGNNNPQGGGAGGNRGGGSDEQG